MKINPQFKARLENQNQLIIENETDFYKYVSSLNCGDLSISVEPFKNKRSLQQNKYMWVLYTIVSKHTGDSTEDTHEYFKQKFLTKRNITDYETGGEIAVINSTTKLNTFEMSEYLENVKRFSAEFFGLYLPDASEYYEN